MPSAMPIWFKRHPKATAALALAVALAIFAL